MRAIAAPVLVLVAGLTTSACAGAETQDVLQAASGASGSSSSGSSPPPSSGGCQEEEPNDSREDANRLTTERCGTLSKDDDRDFLTFRMKPSTRRLGLDFSGNVRLKVTVNGEERVLEPDAAGNVPFKQGADYYIEIRARDSNASVSWRVSLSESDS